MRIDYSEPKKAYVTPQGSNRPRKEPAAFFTTILVVTGVITFIAGFGTGWYLSQKSAKKSFQAATEQNSLENSPKKEPVPVPKTPQAVQPAETSQPQSTQSSAPQPPAAPGTAATDPQLSFYKALPSGQKSNVLGSGINTKDDKSKQPLQAAIPSNLNRPATTDQTKTSPEKPEGGEKSVSRHSENNSFTVQVASFPLRSEAETLKNKLAAKGYQAYIVDSNQGDKGIWYRVRVGKRLEQEAAKELAGKLGKTALVIPD
jgi:cell division septation protein DedD